MRNALACSLAEELARTAGGAVGFVTSIAAVVIAVAPQALLNAVAVAAAKDVGGRKLLA